MHARTITCLFAAFTALAATAPQDPVAPKKGRPPFVFEARTLDLRELIDSCAAYLQWNILVDDRELIAAGPEQTVIELQQPVRTDDAGCVDLLSSLLWSKGFALTPVDESNHVYDVIYRNGARMREISARAVQRTVEQVLARPNSALCVTTVVPLQHINATIATNALRPFFASLGGASSGLTMGNVGNNAAIVVSGPQNAVAGAIALLRTADVAPKEPVPGLAEQVTALAKQVAALSKQVEALNARLAELEKKQ